MFSAAISTKFTFLSKIHVFANDANTMVNKLWKICFTLCTRSKQLTLPLTVHCIIRPSSIQRGGGGMHYRANSQTIKFTWWRRTHNCAHRLLLVVHLPRNIGSFNRKLTLTPYGSILRVSVWWKCYLLDRL